MTLFGIPDIASRTPRFPLESEIVFDPKVGPKKGSSLLFSSTQKWNPMEH